VTEPGVYKRCPDCAELVQPDARICRYCRFDFETGASADGVVRYSAPPPPSVLAGAWEKLNAGDAEGALDDAFEVAKRSGTDPEVQTDLRVFATVAHDRTPRGDQRKRADILAARVRRSPLPRVTASAPVTTADTASAATVGERLRGWWNDPERKRPRRIAVVAVAVVVALIAIGSFTSSSSSPSASSSYSSSSGSDYTPEPEASYPSASSGQENALEQAERYLSHQSFSRKGLIEQLEYEGYSLADATYAVDNVDVDWNEQAALKAKSYLSHQSFSRSGLLEQLVYEGFTLPQATYGVSAAY
jgi:hypothetical protein